MRLDSGLKSLLGKYPALNASASGRREEDWTGDSDIYEAVCNTVLYIFNEHAVSLEQGLYLLELEERWRETRWDFNQLVAAIRSLIAEGVFVMEQNDPPRLLPTPSGRYLLTGEALPYAVPVAQTDPADTAQIATQSPKKGPKIRIELPTTPYIGDAEEDADVETSTSPKAPDPVTASYAPSVEVAAPETAVEAVEWTETIADQLAEQLADQSADSTHSEQQYEADSEFDHGDSDPKSAELSPPYDQPEAEPLQDRQADTPLLRPEPVALPVVEHCPLTAAYSRQKILGFFSLTDQELKDDLPQADLRERWCAEGQSLEAMDDEVDRLIDQGYLEKKRHKAQTVYRLTPSGHSYAQAAVLPDVLMAMDAKKQTATSPSASGLKPQILRCLVLDELEKHHLAAGGEMDFSMLRLSWRGTGLSLDELVHGVDLLLKDGALALQMREELVVVLNPAGFKELVDTSPLARWKRWRMVRKADTERHDSGHI